MKKTIFTAAIFLLTVIACKKESSQTMTMTVVRDCTGTYLRNDGKDYQICNVEKIASFADGATVMATFRKLDACNRAVNMVDCYMYHTKESWIEVSKIK